MLTYLDQIRSARSWFEHVDRVLAEAEDAIREARSVWQYLPADVWEVTLWCRDVERVAHRLLELAREQRTRSFPPFPTAQRGEIPAPPASPFPEEVA